MKYATTTEKLRELLTLLNKTKQNLILDFVNECIDDNTVKEIINTIWELEDKITNFILDEYKYMS